MVTLYSTHCPKCMVLEKKLKSKGIEFNTVTDIEIMQNMGIMQAPLLEVNGIKMQYTESIEWINNQ